MSIESDTRCGAVCGEDVALAAIALHARLRETEEWAFYCRPLPRREIVRLARIVRDYARLTLPQQPKEGV